METIDLTCRVTKEDKIQLSEHQLEDEEEEIADECGFYTFHPEWLQKFRTPKWVLFWLCWASALQGMVVNGLVNVVITTIERRYGLKSSESGLVAGGYDIASFVCLIPVSYYGGRITANKPRWIGLGMLVMALGSLIFALPQFTVPAYRGVGNLKNICPYNGTNQEICHEESTGGFTSINLWLFVISQLLTGAGAAPLYTLGVTFLDESVTKKMSSVYLGIYYTASLLGPAVGYVFGGELLKIYTDFLTNDPNEFGLTPDSNVWIGAWWVGFLLMAIVSAIVSIPIMSLPAQLPGAKEIRTGKVSEAHGNTSFEAFGKLKEIPRAFGQLIVNPTFTFLSLAGASEGFLISGFAAFLPKFMENQFSISASLSAVLMGAITVPAGGGGTFLGGYLVKKLGLKCSGIMKVCIWTSLVCVIFVFSFFLSCPNHNFAGLNTPYTYSFRISLSDECYQNCGCTLEKYDPICGINGVIYYSPCHAGCRKESLIQGNKVYRNCDCIPRPSGFSPIPTTFQVLPESNRTWSAFDAQNISCGTTCNLLWVFVCLAFCVMVSTFMATMPALAATLRCVREEQRSFALGIQWILVRVFGTIPAPLLFGVLIDRTCILWEVTKCENSGSCHVYDNYYMSRYMLGIAVIGKTCSLGFFLLAWWLYVPPVSNNSNGVIKCNDD